MPDRIVEYSQLTMRHPENTEEQTKLERSSAIARHVLETEYHVDFDHPEILLKYWPIYMNCKNAEKLFISHQRPQIGLLGKSGFIYKVQNKCA